MSDPVASRSAFLCTYMSHHPDTLVAYVRHWGKISVPVVSAGMSSIDSKGMVLSYVVKGTDAKTSKQVTIPFEPPLSGYEEVKPRLLAMKMDAEEKLGMTRRPQITTFKIDHYRYVHLTVFMILFLVYVTFSAPGASPIYDFGVWIRSAVGGPPTLRFFWILATSIHMAEATYVLSLCRRHSTGLVVGAQWTIFAFLVGFPAIMNLRGLVHKARINSITKVH